MRGIATNCAITAPNTGVFVGISTSDYLLFQLVSNDGLCDIDAHFGSGKRASVASGRISYMLGLRGPQYCRLTQPLVFPCRRPPRATRALRRDACFSWRSPAA